MKKFIALGALALSVAAFSAQQASAWTNFKFGAGINFGYQAGGNNFGWGLFRNGQPPCSDSCGGGVPTPPPYGQLQPGSVDQGFVGGLTPPRLPLNLSRTTAPVTPSTTSTSRTPTAMGTITATTTVTIVNHGTHLSSALEPC